MNDTVQALAVSGSNLYAGGPFTLAGGLTVNHIAQWGGSDWSALGSGVNDTVQALAVSGGDLIVGGAFAQVCGNPACNSGNLTVNHITQWNGSDWSALGSGVNNNVSALAVSGSEVFVGGSFLQVCGNAVCNSGNLSVNKVAQWNGATWSALGSGVSGAVLSLAVSGSNLFVGGAFVQVCGNEACNSGSFTVNRIAQWNGAAWSALGGGLDNDVLVLAASGSSLYAGGFFTRACDDTVCNSGSLAADHFAQWNGTTWSTLGNGVNRFVNALAVSGTSLYVGGDFFSAGGLAVNHIAQWNGRTWSALGGGVNGTVQALVLIGGSLIVGGGFSQVCGNVACNSGNLTVNNIAQWNGATWSALGNGVDNPVNALAVSENNLFAGGAFFTVCGNNACNSGNLIVNNVAQWNGSTWSALDNGVKGSVLALAVSGSDLYVGGIFVQVCGNAACTSGNLTANHVALFSSGAWSTLGDGVNGFGVRALATSGGSLYVGGFFSEVCGNVACNSVNLTVNNIAEWNGTSWSTLGNGVDSFGVYTLSVSGGDLYVGGEFSQACGNASCNSGNVAVSRIAQWSGSAWSALGSGLNNVPFALAVSERDLYVAGNFDTAGGKPSYFIGRWSKMFAVYLPVLLR